MGFVISTKADNLFYVDDNVSLDACISDAEQTDINAFIEATDSSKTAVQVVRNSMPQPSVRNNSMYKKNVQNFLTNVVIKRFSFATTSTNQFNTKFSFPLSSRENLILIVGRLII